MYHLTINGRPMCAHTSCLAGMADAQRALGTTRAAQCSYRNGAQALRTARRWRKALPFQAVAVVVGDCPHVAEPHV